MLLEIILILAAAFATLYLYATRTYNYWTKLGVRQVCIATKSIKLQSVVSTLLRCFVMDFNTICEGLLGQ